MPTMLILRGIAGHFADRDWPRGALDEPSAIEYAQRRGYEPKVIDVPGWAGPNSEQVKVCLAAIRSDNNVAALYGFSGGGYNVAHVIAKLEPAQRARIKLVIVLGAPNNPSSRYFGPWELVYRTDPPSGHMNGPKALLEEASVNPDQLRRMGKAILDFEARRDSKGHLAVYDLPAGDGGGRYEVAGINERYHPDELAVLVRLLRAHKYDEAESYATEFFVKFTDVVSTWGNLDPGVEFYLRDSAFNRGPTGAARILQRALGVGVDGKVGPLTKAALATSEPKELLAKLRTAREWYERVYAHRDEDSKFWRGLKSRWEKALAKAKEFQA